MTEDSVAREPLNSTVSQGIRNSRAVVDARLHRMSAITPRPESCDSTAGTMEAIEREAVIEALLAVADVAAGQLTGEGVS